MVDRTLPSVATSHGASRVHTREHGFSLIELVIVMAVLGILAAATFQANSSTKRATSQQRGVAVARVYADAIDAFARDHGDRIPVANSSDWPIVPNGKLGAGFGRGPVDAGENSRPYMEHVPEPVQSGEVDVTTATASAGQGTASGSAPTRIVYSTTSSGDWRIEVQTSQRTDRGTTWESKCSFGRALAPEVHTC